jgi:predicted enzyme related to lactoylglutathione lyase
MSNQYTGRFVWHELMTTDPAKSVAFYSALVDWSIHEMPMGLDSTYRIFNRGTTGVAGAMVAPPGMPSAWLVYVGSDDVDATVARVTENGGSILVPPTTVPDMLRFAVAVDPQGGCFGVFMGLGPTPPNLPEGPGAFVWDELHTKDQRAAAAFYGAVFGWTGKTRADDPMQYWHWKHGTEDVGGMTDLQSPHAPPHWLPYLAVNDVAASTAKVRELGGAVLMDAITIERVGTFSIVQDTTGATFALFHSGRG